MYCGDAVDTRGRDSSGGGIYRLPVGGPALVQGSILVSTARQRVDFVFSIRIQVWFFFLFLFLQKSIIGGLVSGGGLQIKILI